jgi:hypothetical protein
MSKIMRQLEIEARAAREAAAGAKQRECTASEPAPASQPTISWWEEQCKTAGEALARQRCGPGVVSGAVERPRP